MSFNDNSILPLIDSQIPQFIRDDHPNFVSFIKAYYEWMENSEEGSVLYDTKNLPNYRDIDRTTDEFLEYFKKDFLPYFPAEIALDERKLIKTAREFYSKKGSLESIKFLFRVLYDKEVEIFYPKEQVLKASDGKWNLPKSIKIILSSENSYVDLNLLKKCLGVGSVSKARCRIESLTKYVDSVLDLELVEIFISNLTRDFQQGENIEITYYDSSGNEQIFSEKIVGGISSVTIDPNNRGLKYRGTEKTSGGAITYSGDPVVVYGGLNSGGIKAVAYVDQVTAGGITSVTVLKGGYGFREDPNTVVYVMNAPGDVGYGANVVVQSLDTGNQFYVKVNTDEISNLANVTLSSTYPFANLITANANTTIANAFSYANLFFAPLKTLAVNSKGFNYSSEPTLDFDVVYRTSNNTIQNMDSLGFISGIEIVSGGINYKPSADKIYFSSSVGYGANAIFTVDANGTINSISIISRGEGYFDMPPIGIANSSNNLIASNGTGAVLVAYGFGDGESIDLAVEDVGRILSLRLVNRGFNYASTPNVSLKVQDIQITPISNSQFFTTDEIIYQGTSSSNASFVAYVDQYDRPNSILRIYNYRGTLSTGAPLKTTLFQSNIANPSSPYIKVYGNGKAKATAEFLSSIIEYPGFWSKTDGFLSWDQRLQDSKRYHNFSYEIEVDKALSTYKNALLSVMHPTGTIPLGLYTTHDEKRPAEIDTLKLYTANNSLTGNVSSNGTANLIGTGTLFKVSANANATIVIGTASRQFVKVISNVVSNTLLTLESSLTYIANNKLTISNGSNVLVVSTSSTELIANDVVTYMNNGTINTGKILLVSGNNITLNLVNTYFTTNATDVMYSVNPSINNQSYIIISV